MIYLAAVSAALLVHLAWQTRSVAQERQGFADERAALLAEFKAEREVWARERTDLNNRIQIPQAAPFMTDEDPQDGVNDIPVLPGGFALSEEELEQAKAELEAVGYDAGPVL